MRRSLATDAKFVDSTLEMLSGLDLSELRHFQYRQKALDVLFYLNQVCAPVLKEKIPPALTEHLKRLENHNGQQELVVEEIAKCKSVIDAPNQKVQQNFTGKKFEDPIRVAR